MKTSLRQIDPSVHLTSEASLEALGEIVSPEQIKKILQPLGKCELRVRKLTMVLVVLIASPLCFRRRKYIIPRF